ncbi:hypothetical protein GX50_00735 [[Emmonsia] crescens]|uniref:Uncharacterized protein n=1 Tax=[Emmonsia] crescens TaxID=73230 RepID=A0A2B7ZSZ0_9EURO|nr:hypothetical protein GX50_00735 [Emmonsia crescens]
MASLYTWEEFPKLMKEAQGPSEANLTSAADLLARMLEESQIPYGFMGGYALKLRGSARNTTDIDIAVEATMLQIREVLLKESRLALPKGPTASVLRIFVLTGGEHDSSNELPSLVEMDIIFNGSLGAPTDVASGVETLNVETVAGNRSYPVLNVHNQMVSKLGAFWSRPGQNDKDYLDILFCLARYSGEIYSVRAQLDYEQRDAFIESFRRKNPGQSQGVAKLKQILGVV